MSKRMLSLIILFLFIQLTPGLAQYENGINDINDVSYSLADKIKPISLIDVPTANFLLIRNFQIKLRVYDMGGMLAGLTVGLTPKLMFGVTYGGQNIVGHGSIRWNGAPGVNVRYRVYEETERYPTVSLGFDSQGYGPFYEDLNRYQIKSMGFYIIGSKNFFFMRNFGLHGGINYSDNNRGSENDINFFVGAHFYVEKNIALIWEHNFAINDNDSLSVGEGKGYMNVAVRWTVTQNLMLELSVKNLLKNNKIVEGIDEVANESRELKIIYFENF